MRRRKYYSGIAHPRTLSSLYLLSTLNVTHVKKSSRPSPAFHVMGSKVAYNKYARSGSGPGNEANTGLRTPIRDHPPYAPLPPCSSLQSGNDKDPVKRGVGTGGQRGHIQGAGRWHGLCQPIVPCPQARWDMETSNQSQVPISVVAHHFKMETIRTVKGLIKPGDWLLKLDLKDAYLTVPIHQNHRKYLRFHWQGQIWQFQVLSFGLNRTPCTFTKLANSLNITSAGCESDHIPGRYAPDGKECPGSQCSLEGSSGDFSGTGVCRQLEEERIPAISETGVPWVCHQLQGNGDITTPPETSVSSVTGEKDPMTGKGDNPSVGPTPRDDDSSPPSDPPCSPALSTPGEDQDSSSSAGSHIYLNDPYLHSRKIGPAMVGRTVTDPQWQTTPDHAMGSDNRVRRITHRMGSQLLGERYRWTVVPGRENPTYQLLGAESGFLSIESICAKPAAFSSTPPDGQHHSDCLPESHGRHPLSTTFSTSSRNMGVVYTEENYNPCGQSPQY